MSQFQRSQLSILLERIEERPEKPPRHMIVVTGPRQTGKTTLVQQALERTDIRSTYVRGDDPVPAHIAKDALWLEKIWQQAREKAEDSKRGHILVLDEIQRIQEWSSAVKVLWDADRFHERNLRIIILGSSPLMMQKGLSESMAGRFETIRLTQWSYLEMAEAFGFSLDQYFYFGGYPGTAPLIYRPERWQQYVQSSIIETNIERDIVERMAIHKPVLLKQLFEIGSEFSAQIVSYRNLLGQLDDKGNVTTLADYLELLGRTGLLTGLQQYAGNIIRVRRSSPKLLVLDAALMTANCGYTFEEAKVDRSFWGHLVESVVGAHLCNSGLPDTKVYYWRGPPREVDFVLQHGNRLLAIEVKSGRRKRSVSGLAMFKERFPSADTMIVGTGGIPFEEFLSVPAQHWFEKNG